ncbi:hypothetical protein WN51_09788 [Melipona quadrifasciata]|uniref:Uncharacterized protein n=1 Tax=Melipona quadrifasciata TaxID=166423 RepID=A0A0N0BIH7_9HYME|nr:hypothetical protein WN51_09788 [Melipona quadrifasciata]
MEMEYKVHQAMKDLSRNFRDEFKAYSDFSAQNYQKSKMRSIQQIKEALYAITLLTKTFVTRKKMIYLKQVLRSAEIARNSASSFACTTFVDAKIGRAPKRGEIKRGDFHELTLGSRKSSHPPVATLASTKVTRWDGMSFKDPLISIWDWLQWSDLRTLPLFYFFPLPTKNDYDFFEPFSFPMATLNH